MDAVTRLHDVVEAVKKEPGALPEEPVARFARLVARIAWDRGVTSFEVPAGFPVAQADALRGAGFGVRWLPAPFVAERSRKTPEEVEKIRGAIGHTEAAMRVAVDRIARATVRGQGLFEGAQPLTAEGVRLAIDIALLERGCHGYVSIVAGGEQGVDPHERGSGPLPAHLPILLDIFPRDLTTRYHGDMTRTVVKGSATSQVKKMFVAVKEAKQAAEATLRDGVDGADVHAAVEKVFSDAGFKTGVENGRMAGFFHGTGHGLGLDVHEYPRISKFHETLKAGHVVTVEPGLYYPGIGGVRLEDDVVLTKEGCSNLCSFESVLEV